MSSRKQSLPHSFSNKQFDTIVIGSGYIGYAAAERLVSNGQQILLIEPSGQLLWESTSCLINDATDQQYSAAWQSWLSRLQLINRTANNKFDPVVAEIQAAKELRSRMESGECQVLFYAYPVKVEYDDSNITSLLLATKAGLRRVFARQWIDTTEQGILMRLATGEKQTRRTVRQGWSCALQSNHWDALEAPLSDFSNAHNMSLSASTKAGERYLSWDDAQLPWHQTMMKKLRLLRTSFTENQDLLVSHCASQPYPIYDSSHVLPLSDSQPGNLQCLSPAYCSTDLHTLADRYNWGMSAQCATPKTASMTLANIPSSADSIDPHCLTFDEESQCEVLVVGTGTSGSVAAITSARQGAQTIAIDFADFPGGVGTGGGITGYFFGIGSKEMESIDALTDEINILLIGESPDKDAWHHEAKKLAIMQLFDELGVSFYGNGLLFGVESHQGQVNAALVAFGDKLVRLKASTYIDSTGDGDLCAFAGAAYKTGRSGDGRTLAYSQAALTINYEDHRPKLKAINFDAGWLDPNDPEDLSRARLVGIQQYHESTAIQKNKLLMIAPLLGIRQSRHIQTDYILQLDDLVAQRRFEDCIGEASCHADSHSVDFEFEDDEMVFYYWACRLFRHPLHTQLPYRMLLPKGLHNVWIACRAAGMSNNAFYAIRMQRDMQHIGAVAGASAANIAMKGLTAARSEDNDVLHHRIENTDSTNHANEVVCNPIDSLKQGRSGIALWRVSQDRSRYNEEVRNVLHSQNSKASFYAACVLAMWADPIAEPRLIEALVGRENGAVDPLENQGAYGQEIDVPFWLIAVVMLRCCGSNACLPALRTCALEPEIPLNVRTSIALTVERLAQRKAISTSESLELLDNLIAYEIPDAQQMPSRSIARKIRNENQLTLPNDYGVDTSQDHGWQLHLIICRVRTQLGFDPQPRAYDYSQDPRAYVSQSFMAFF
ncbi:FAD-dependent oxidoreductase [Cerasicoccus arenae]|uniref:FAD-dependent oxidoreductase n=1 Tax=Cerasicoccus arenae TaxID=424488 RepID=A0A8J3DI51_9BACT|nr:FAD-dependent oxidoreductase [Cerasicoccus arenae]MBK1859066.1 FAD-dependent oxidoreductase [Cerasicoccus arenae]GHC03450.1 hypothetical protein GCM10007047_20050 [Cerasicoccus arenae]